MLKNTLTVLRGSVTAQAIGFLALPVLTRLFSPEAFGQFQLYQSALLLLLVTAAMRYEVALLQAGEGEELHSLVLLCVLINVGTAGLAAIVCWIVASVDGMVAADTRPLLWFMPLGVLLGGMLQTLGYLTLRGHAFSLGATAKTAQAGGYAVAGVGIGTFAPLSLRA